MAVASGSAEGLIRKGTRSGAPSEDKTREHTNTQIDSIPHKHLIMFPQTGLPPSPSRPCPPAVLQLSTSLVESTLQTSQFGNDRMRSLSALAGGGMHTGLGPV